MGEGVGGGGSEILSEGNWGVLEKFTVHGRGAGKFFLILLNFPPAHPCV